MRTFRLTATIFAFAAGAMLTLGSALAAAPDPTATAQYALLQEGGGGGTDVVQVATWTFVGVLVGGLLLAALYFFKRQVGGFPANPTWVAPISIERSETFPDEGDFGDVAPDAHGTHH